MLRYRRAFSLVELLIVVMLLAIMAMIVMPKFSSSANDTRQAALATDHSNAVRQIELYQHQHGGRYPEIKETGSRDTGNFINRMIGRTTFAGKLDPSGPFGPYLMEWPANPFLGNDEAAAEIKFGATPPAPRDDSTGWYYAWSEHRLYINSIQGEPAHLGL